VLAGPVIITATRWVSQALNPSYGTVIPGSPLRDAPE
jgi:hypothetical protein